jgi:hypothetical protein
VSKDVRDTTKRNILLNSSLSFFTLVASSVVVLPSLISGTIRTVVVKAAVVAAARSAIGASVIEAVTASASSE